MTKTFSNMILESSSYLGQCDLQSASKVLSPGLGTDVVFRIFTIESSFKLFWIGFQEEYHILIKRFKIDKFR